MNATANFYAQPSYRGGINFPIYSGSRRQAGGSIFGIIKRAVIPVLKAAGKEAGKSAIGFASDVASDLISGRNLKETMQNRGKQRASQFARNSVKRVYSNVVGSDSRPPAKRRRVQSSFMNRSNRSGVGTGRRRGRRTTAVGRKVSRQMLRKPRQTVSRAARRNTTSKLASTVIRRLGNKALSHAGKSAAKLF